MKTSQLLSVSLKMSALCLVGVSLPALAQDKPVDASVQAAAEFDATAASLGDNKATADLSERFTSLAGSPDNANALVTGLRTGGEVKLTTTVDSKPVTSSFQPATGKMGYGNVFLSLSLANENLAAQGITNPTPEQLQAALNGGTITTGIGTEAKTVTLPGVLALRSSGQGWGQIAQQLDVKLGHVTSDLRSANGKVNHVKTPPSATKPEKIERVDRPQRVERPQTMERPVRPNPPHRPERVGPPGR